jgi:hypothetical protein
MIMLIEETKQDEGGGFLRPLHLIDSIGIFYPRYFFSF